MDSSESDGVDVPISDSVDSSRSEDVNQVQKLLASNPQISNDVNYLRSWLEKQHHLPRTVSDHQLVAFLNCSDYSLEATKKCIDAHFTIKCSSPEFFKNRDPLSEEVQQAWNIFDMTHLSTTTPEGYRCMFARIADPDPSHFFPDAHTKLSLMLGDAGLRYDALTPGIVLIADVAGAQLEHLTRAKMTSIKKHMQYVQEGLPVKMRAIYLLNVSPIIYAIIAMVRPFMSKEVFELIHFHTGDEQSMEEFYKAVPRKMLPKDYGGEDDTVAELKEKWQETLASYRDWFREMEEQCVVDESKRDGIIRNDGEFFGQNGSFKQIELD